MKYFSGVLQVKIKVTFSPGLIFNSNLGPFFTWIRQTGKTPGFNLIVTVMLSAARREIVKEAKEGKKKAEVLCY